MPTPIEPDRYDPATAAAMAELGNSLEGLPAYLGIRTTHVDPRRLIQPLFVRPGSGVRQEIGAMPGVCQLSIDEMVDVRKWTSGEFYKQFIEPTKRSAHVILPHGANGPAVDMITTKAVSFIRELSASHEHHHPRI